MNSEDPRSQPRRSSKLQTLVLLSLCLTVVAARAEGPQADDYGREARLALGAHHLCSGLWVVGRDYKRTPEQVLAQDIAPFPPFGWEETFEYEVDRHRHMVTVTAPGLPPRAAKYNGDQGCTILPRGEEDVYFDPVKVPRNLPDPAKHLWPTGDVRAHELPAGVDASRLAVALDWAMAQEAQNTRALVALYNGMIIGERYAPGWTKDTPQISWSQGKSITAALIGVLVHQGHFGPNDPAPVKEWQVPGDPRREIRIKDLLRMSSGLDFANLGLAGPDSYTKANEHMRIYFDALNVFEHAVNQPQGIPPNSQFRYRNSDPLTLGKIVRETVEGRGEEYLTFPQRALFDRIGARNFVLEPDPYGNFIMTGYDFGSAWDWARFGLLHLWDGTWEGKRILAEGWVELISTPAPADPNRGYGGLFWLNRGGARAKTPEDSFWSAGFMGQNTIVIPSRDMVIVRLGPSPGDFNAYIDEVVGRILEAVPQR